MAERLAPSDYRAARFVAAHTTVTLEGQKYRVERELGTVEVYLCPPTHQGPVFTVDLHEFQMGFRRSAMADARIDAEREAAWHDAEADAASEGEHAMMAGMAFGAAGYNDARGYDSYTPEPCGHHCDWDCPICGE